MTPTNFRTVENLHAPTRRLATPTKATARILTVLTLAIAITFPLVAGAPAAPEIAIEQPVGMNVADGDSRDFGSVLVGNSSSLIFSITNSGDANLNLTLPITFSGVDAALFTVTVPPTTPVLPGDTATFTVRFAPMTSGAKAAALQLANNDGDENPFDINLTGNGSQPIAPVNLGTTADFVILAGAAVTTTGGGAINGNVGASPIAGSAIGVTCAQVNGTIFAVDASGPPCSVIDSTFLTTAKGDLTIAYNDAAGRMPVPSGPNLNPGLIPGSGNIGGMTLAPGLYKFTTTALISGSDVTLSGGSDDVWIFQCAQDLQLTSGIKVILAGGAQAKNIF